MSLMFEREFVFSDDDFEVIRSSIYEHAGISLNISKKNMVYSRIARRLRTLGLSSFQAYLSYLDTHEEEWENFVNSLTTNLTSFFREAHHFPILAEHVLAQRGKGTLYLWSSACSTGEEAYSMAMTVIDAFGSFRPPVKILATDVDTNVVRHATEGVYSMERVERLSGDYLKRFFLRGKGERAGYVRVRPELREMISFRTLNLLAPGWPIRGPFEAIFCRNVMIYFDKPTQYKILSRFKPLLRPEGLLFAGHSESFGHASDLFRLRGKTVYTPVRGAA